MKKIIHELDIDSLVALAQGAEPEEIADKISEAGKFIYDLNIKHGDTKISAQLVFHTYKHWKGWANKRQARPQFIKDFNKYFEASRTSNGMVYLLNPKPFDLSQENYWQMRNELRNEKSKKAKKPTRQS